MASKVAGPFRLGEWTVRPRENRLQREGGESRTLEPKVVEVLVFLAEEPGRVRLRQEILDAVWPDAYVTDEVLTNAVWELRQALGDDARDPRYIKTVPRKGYGLVSSVEPLDASPGVEQAVGERRAFSPRRLGIALAIGLVLVASGLLWSQRMQAPAGAWPESVAVLPLEAISEKPSEAPSEQAFAAALTDNLITELAASRRFEVASRSSVVELRERGLTATEIARALDVDAFLEGTLSFSETGRARLSLQLIDRRRDRHLWARVFEDETRENLAAQRRLARRVTLDLVRSGGVPRPPARPAAGAVARDETNEDAWRFRAAGEMWSSPRLTDTGFVVLGSDDGNVYAIDPRTGREQWRFAATGAVRDEVTLAPSRVFVSANGYVHALDSATGKESWRRKLSIISPATPVPEAGGVLVVGSYDRHLYGLAPEDGSVRWRLPTRGENRTASAVSGTRVAAGTDAGEVILLDASVGRSKARLDLDSAVAGLAMGPEDELFVATDGGYLYRFSAQGEERWRRRVGDQLGSGPLVADGVLYQGTGEGRVLALDAGDGETLWTFEARDGIGATPRLADDVLYVGSLDHDLYALDAVSGEESWKFTGEGWIATQPLVAGDRVIFADLSGVAYGLPRGGPPEQPPEPSWPEPGHPRLFAGAPGPELAWRTEVASPGRFTVADDAIFLGTGMGVTALDAATGRVRWRFPATGGVEGEPLLHDGHLVFASVGGIVSALDPESGRERWRHELGAETYAPPAAGFGMVVVGDYAGRVHALDESTGEELWAAQTGHFVNASPLVLRDRVVVGSCDESVWAFDRRRGTTLWTTHAGECVVSDTVRYGDVAIVGTYAGDVMALDLETGIRRWTFASGGEHIWFEPLVTDDTVYLGTGDYNLYALDARTGNELWRFETGNRALTDVARHGETILFGSHDRHLYAVDRRTGTELWRLETTRPVMHLQVVGDILYFVGDDAYVYAYRLAES